VIARLVAESGLDALREPITERPYRKVSIDCPDEAKPGVMDRLGSTLPDAFPDATVDTDHGVRLSSRTRRGLSCDRPARSRTCGYIYESDEVDELIADVEAVVEDVVAAVADAE